jgi:hypothetical protein
MKHLGSLRCADCGGRHEILASGSGGVLSSLDKCTGKVPKGATTSQLNEMADAVRHVDSVVTELKARFEESDWDQVQALSDEMSIKLGTLNQIAGEVEKS